MPSDDVNVVPTDANLMPTTPLLAYTWTSGIGPHETLPINSVSWYEAYAFCIWDGGFLPSETEWLYAAAGGVEQREYPWGSAPPGEASLYSIYSCMYPSDSFCSQDAGAANVAPVGTATLGVGRWGQLDLTGDVLEWDLDYYATFVDPCADCAYLTPHPSPERTTRGAVFSASITFLSVSDREGPGLSASPPSVAINADGFRCGRAP
jgi:formylglycine-generating enzyme required for sulfatase activity